ncbi:hypothetical protein [Streptomyces sp. NPDC046942]|uniref:hypothetical protein n=1 Tax=Streptomyces sp. NPDC046942 TaxID=3155137 RepID=UPI0033D37A9E
MTGDSRMLGQAMTQGMLTELERRNCWTLAEALGHDGPHRLQHRSAWRRHHRHQATEAHRRWNNITAAATT